MDSFSKYFQPKSLTWWAGVASVIVGIAQMAGLQHAAYGVVGELVQTLTGGTLGSSPAQMIVGGLGLIGIRAKMEAMS